MDPNFSRETKLSLPKNYNEICNANLVSYPPLKLRLTGWILSPSIFLLRV